MIHDILCCKSLPWQNSNSSMTSFSAGGQLVSSKPNMRQKDKLSTTSSSGRMAKCQHTRLKDEVHNVISKNCNTFFHCELSD